MQKQKVNWKHVSLGLILILAISLSSLVLVLSTSTPSSTMFLSGGKVPSGASYTIFVESSVYYAKDSWGFLAFSGSNGSEVVDSVLALLTTGGEVYFQKGTYYFDNPLIVSVSGIHFRLEQGTIFYNNVHSDYMIKVTGLASRINDFRLDGGYIQGNSSDFSGFLYINNTNLDYITNTVFRYSGILNSWAVYILSSWQIYFINVQIYNVQNCIWHGGDAGYLELVNCYLDAYDYGALGSTYNYEVFLDHAGLTAFQTQFEGGSAVKSVGIYVRDWVGSVRLYECAFESNTHLYDLNFTSDVMSYRSEVHGGYVNGSKVNIGNHAVNQKFVNFYGSYFEQYGTASISSSTTVAFNHNLWGAPTYVEASFNSTAITGWTWTATATQITITVNPTGSYTVYWSAYYQP